MGSLSEKFNIYIDIVMLCIGLYMAFVQGPNLIGVNHLNKEGQFSKVIGWIYILIGVIGFIISTF